MRKSFKNISLAQPSGKQSAGTLPGNEWTSLLPQEQLESIENSSLGTADFSQLESGPYRLRLSVFGTGIEPLGQCQISIFIGQSPNQSNSDS